MPVQPTQPTVHKETPITIGSDPELLLYSPLTNEHISADEYIHDSNRNLPFGCDGHSSTAELRPNPATSPLKHAQNIKALLMKYAIDPDYKPLYGLSFYSSGMEDPIGGHIHIGHPLVAWKQDFRDPHDQYNFYEMMAREILNKEINPDIYNHDKYSLDSQLKNKVQENRNKLAHILDMLVSFPLMFTEVPEHAIRRKKSYGRLGEWREKEYGIEYRTPSSWMSSEKLAKSVLSLAYATAHDVLLKNYNPSNNFTMIKGFNDNYQIHNTDLLRPFLERSEHEIRSLTLYPKYKEYINYLLYNAKKGRELYDTEVKLGWGIPFELLTHITLFTIKELTEKVSQALAIPKSERGNVNLHTQYVVAKSSDYMIPQIRENINICLNKIISQPAPHTNRQAVYLFAKKESYGDIVDISASYNVNLDYKKQKQLTALIQKVAKEFGYANPITVKIHVGYDELNIAEDVSQVAKVGLGRKIREQHTYLAEAIMFTILLYVNNGIYQGYTVNHKTGKRTNKPIISRTILSQFKKNLVGKSKRVPEQTADREEAQAEEALQTRMYAYQTNTHPRIMPIEPMRRNGASLSGIRELIDESVSQF